MNHFIFSLVSFLAPFFFPAQCWFIIFLFPFFTFNFLKNTSKIMWLFAWGYLAINLHLASVYYALWQMAYEPKIITLLPLFFLSLYCASFPTFFLYISAFFLRISKNITYEIMLFSLYLLIYLLIIDYVLFWPFGLFEGYPFANPLIPLAMYPELLWALPYLGNMLLLFCFCLTCASIILFLKERTFLSCILMTFCLLFWGYGFVIHSKEDRPEWLDTIAAIPLLFPPTCNPLNIIMQEIENHKAKNPLVSIFIFPESSCHIVPHWIGKETLILGSFIEKDTRRYNTLFCLGKNQTHYYCKRHLLPMTERDFPFSKFYMNKPLTISSCPRPQLVLSDQLIMVPYICSELFFSHVPDDDSSFLPILFICNDWWFSPYFRRLMLLAGRLKAIEWHRSILYVSYAYGLFLDHFGNIHPLKQSF